MVGKERPNLDEDVYERLRRPRPRTLGQHVPEIFAVDTEKPRDSITEELSQKSSAETIVRRSCVTSGSAKKNFGAAQKILAAWRGLSKREHGGEREARATPGWGGVRVQIDSGAIDAVCPKEIAKAFEMKETEMSKRGIGYVPPTVISIENDGEEKGRRLHR